MPAPLFPVFIKLADRPCLVVGAGEIAKAKIASLLEAGARVLVIAPEAAPEIQVLAASKTISWQKRRYRASDLDGAFLAIAATSDTAVNNVVFAQAQRLGVLCNAVDDPPNCDFYFPAVVRRGDLQIAISTAGESPAFAQNLRRAFEEAFDLHLGDWLGAIGQVRREILATYPASEARKRALHVLATHEPSESQDGLEGTGVQPPAKASDERKVGAKTVGSGTQDAIDRAEQIPGVRTAAVSTQTIEKSSGNAQ
jgi:precorrin-2 dehydrogenase / sirohydrochlorin ferrochelatase